MPRSLIILAGALIATGAQASGQDAPASPANIVVYEPAFFAESRPETAFDMVSRVPGFTLIENDDEVRGYAGAAGNVLFDGRPPSGKQQSLEAILRRIPAAAVARIELVRGGSPGIEMSGFDLVVNIVRGSQTRTNFTVEGGASITRGGGPRPTLRVDGSRQSGERRLEGSISFVSEIDDESGSGWLDTFDAATMLVEREPRREREAETVLSSNLEYETPGLGGELTATGNLQREDSVETISSLLDDSDRDRSTERETLLSGEAGLRYRRPTADGGRINVLLLQQVGHLDASQVEEDERFTEATRTSETIGRIEYRRERESISFDASIEGALNGLDSRARLEDGGSPVLLPGGDAEVREQRAEAALGLSWRVRPSLLLETALRAEVSTLRSLGAQRLSFLYWKPRLAMTASWGPGQVQASIERQVGQLDFRDFVASASLDRDDVSAGAASLRPPQTWIAAIAYELRFWEAAAVTLTYKREWIDDVVDRVAVIAGNEIFDAVGNIGPGNRQIAQIEFSLPLARLGLRGVLVRGTMTWRRSRVTDPVTGLRRIISEDIPLEGEVSLSHDLPGGRWSWGLNLSLAEREHQFRFDEVRVERQAMSLAAHVEFRPRESWRVRLEGSNLTGRTLNEQRKTYDGLRSIVPLEEIERRRIGTAARLLLTVRYAFAR